MIIHFNNFNEKIINRNLFLNETDINKLKTKIKKNMPILFMPNDIYDSSLRKRNKLHFEYHIIIYGSLSDGRKCVVLMENIKPYFEVMVPPNIKKEFFIDKLEKMINLELEKNNKEYCNCDIVKGKYFKYYSENESNFVRFYFRKIKFRNKILKLFKNKLNDCNITHDDYSYQRVFLRDNNIKMGNVCEIKEYIYCDTNDGTEHEYFKLPTFIIDYKNIKNKENISLYKDKSFLLSWDIETYSPLHEVPKYENNDDRIFMIGMTYHFYNKTSCLKKICLMDFPCEDIDDHLIIICNTEKNIIIAFAKLVGYLSPEFISGFNDSYYDWPWLIERAKKHSIINKLNLFMNPFKLNNFNFDNDNNFIEKNFIKYYKYNSVKIESTYSAEANSLFIPGIIPIDVRIEFRKLYPSDEKSSLNYFLEKHNLKSKYDLKYEDMFNYYENMLNNKKKKFTKKMLHDMKEIAKYCVIDAKKCQELLVKRDIIPYERSLCSLSFTTIFDSFYRANGIRVKNIIVKYGNKKKIKYSMSTIKKNGNSTYKGANVLNPIKGAVNNKLTLRERIKKLKFNNQQHH